MLNKLFERTFSGIKRVVGDGKPAHQENLPDVLPPMRGRASVNELRNSHQLPDSLASGEGREVRGGLALQEGEIFSGQDAIDAFILAKNTGEGKIYVRLNEFHTLIPVDQLHWFDDNRVKIELSYRVPMEVNPREPIKTRVFSSETQFVFHSSKPTDWFPTLQP